MERAAELEPWTKQMRTMDHPDFDFALILWAEGDKVGSRERLERLLERAEHSGDYSSLPFILTNLAGADFRDANLGLARDRLDRAERLPAPLASGRRTPTCSPPKSTLPPGRETRRRHGAWGMRRFG